MTTPTTMRLHTNPASPFGRKVKVLAHEAGLFDRLELLAGWLTDALDGEPP